MLNKRSYSGTICVKFLNERKLTVLFYICQGFWIINKHLVNSFYINKSVLVFLVIDIIFLYYLDF